jgi:hypothetical protein
MIVQNSKMSRRDGALLTVGFNLRCGDVRHNLRYGNNLIPHPVRDARLVARSVPTANPACRRYATIRQLERDSLVATLLRNDGAIACTIEGGKCGGASTNKMVAPTAAAFSAFFPLLRHAPVIPTAGRNLIQIILLPFSFSPFLLFSLSPF